MDADLEILSDLPHPLIDSVRKEVERPAQRPAVPQEPTVVDGLQRALRRQLVEHERDAKGLKSDEFIEVSPFTPWKRYGPSLRMAIEQHGMLFLHTETDDNDQPTLLAIGTMPAKTIVCHLTDGNSGANWDGFASAFPQLAATLDHGQLVKVTSSLAATKRLLASESTKYEHEIIDVEWFFNEVIQDIDLGCGTAALKVKRMVWAVLGRQHGPVTRDNWNRVHGQSQDYPHERDLAEFVPHWINERGPHVTPCS